MHTIISGYSDNNQFERYENTSEKHISAGDFVENVILSLKEGKAFKSGQLPTYISQQLIDPNFVMQVINLTKKINIHERLNIACLLAESGDSSMLRELLIFQFLMGRSPIDFIEEFNITDQKILFEFAKIAAAHDGRDTSDYIKNYGIKNEEHLIEIATISAAQNGEGTSEFIHKYGIKDEKARVAIAKIAAAHSGSGTSKFIKNYGIKDEKARIEIAKIAAGHSGGGTSKFIQNYDITDKQALVEIAKIAAAENGEGLSAHIQKYGIKGEKILIAIAKIAAAQSGWGVSEHIHNYGIKDKKALIEIAKIAAAQSGLDTSDCIQNYGIIDEPTLVEIAKIAAIQHARGTSKYIHKYGIKDQVALLEIAKIAVIQDCLSTSQYIHKYGIKNPIDRLSIFLTAFKLNKDTLNFIENYELGFYEDFFLSKPENILIACKELFSDKNEKFTNSSIKLIEYLINKIEKNNNEVIKNQLNNLLKYTITIYSLREKTPPPITLKTWDSILEYRDPKMRYQLTAAIAEMDDEQASIYGKIINEKSPEYTFLPALLLSKMIKNDDKWETLLHQIQNRLFKDSSYQRPLMNVLNMLNNTPELSEEDIIGLLTESIDIKNKKKTLFNLMSIQGILSLNGAQELKAKAFEKNNNDVSKIYLTIFKKNIPIKDVEGFSEKFSTTFESYRSNESLLVYAGTLNKYPEKNKALSTLATYVESVLNGNFEKERYSDSEHLTTIFKDREKLKEAWIKGSKESLKTENSKSIDQINIERNYFQYFKDKIIKDKHLDITKYDYLKDYLTTSDEDKLALTNKLDEVIEKQLKSVKSLQEELKIDKKQMGEFIKQIALLKSLQLQKAMISLAKMKDLINVDQLKTLQKVDKLLKEIDSTCEFNHDIEGLIKSFEVNTVSDELTLVDTDDPWDLFLCGTEVEGSCQRVDGHPELNVGLLGYLLDGKNRLIAIKDSDGKIVARRLLRILWDANNKKPVLMMERTYPAMLPKEYQQEIDRFVKQRAKSLGLAIYEEGTKDDVKLESKSSKSPWEYVDSADGLQSHGIYTIDKATLVQEE